MQIFPLKGINTSITNIRAYGCKRLKNPEQIHLEKALHMWCVCKRIKDFLKRILC